MKTSIDRDNAPAIYESTERIDPTRWALYTIGEMDQDRKSWSVVADCWESLSPDWKTVFIDRLTDIIKEATTLRDDLLKR